MQEECILTQNNFSPLKYNVITLHFSFSVQRYTLTKCSVLACPSWIVIYIMESFWGKLILQCFIVHNIQKVYVLYYHMSLTFSPPTFLFFYLLLCLQMLLSSQDNSFRFLISWLLHFWWSMLYHGTPTSILGTCASGTILQPHAHQAFWFSQSPLPKQSLWMLTLCQNAAL